MSIDRIKAGLAAVRAAQGDDWAVGAYANTPSNPPTGFSMGAKREKTTREKIEEKLKELALENQRQVVAAAAQHSKLANLQQIQDQYDNLLVSHPDERFPVTWGTSETSQDKSPVIMNIPLLPAPLPPEPVWDDPENPPFKSVAELQEELLIQICRAVDKQPGKLFSVYAPRSFSHQGVTENFVGGEEYRLKHIRVAPDEKDPSVRVLRYWFEAKHAANLKYIHDIPEKTACDLFGHQNILEYISRRAQEVGAGQKWQSAKNAILTRERKEQYAASGIEFGSW